MTARAVVSFPNVLESEPSIGQWLLSILDQGNADATIAIATDSTGLDATGDGTNGWPHRLAAWLNATYPAYTVNLYQWNSGTLAWPGSPTATYAGSGAQKIDIWNLSVSGKNENYALSYAESQLAAKQPQLLFIAYGENGDTLYDRYRNRMLTVIHSVLWKSPKTEVVLIAQPQQVSPASGTGQQQLRLLELMKITRSGICSLVNVLRAFQETGNVAALLAADGIHPIDAGKTVWLNAITTRLVLNRREGPRASRPSGLTVAGNQQITNGEFTSWPPSSSGWTHNNITATQDSVTFETPYTSSAKLAVTASTSFGSYISQALPDSCIGKWVTISVRLYVPSGQTDDVTLGRIGIQSTHIDANHGLTDGLGPRDKWYWETFSVYIDPTDTSPVVKIYADSKGSNATHVGDYINVQRVYVAVGDEPRVALAQGATGATGATGDQGAQGAAGSGIRAAGNVCVPAAPAVWGATATQTAKQYRGFRVIVPTTGTLTDFYIACGASSGNVEGVILDDTVTTRQRLWTSGIVACPAADSAWHSLGNPGLVVTAGDHLDLVVGADNATASFLTWTLGNQTFEGQWPASFLPAPHGALPIVCWQSATFGTFGMTSNYAESSLTPRATCPLVMCRIV